MTLIEQRLSTLSQSLYALMHDPAFIDLMESALSDEPPLRRYISRDAETILSQYFWDFDSFCSLYLLSSQYSNCFYNATSLPDIILPDSLVYADQLRAEAGTIHWFPTARYDSIIDLDERYSKYFSDYDVISIGTQMDMRYVKYGYPHKYGGSREPPMILISISSSIFDQWLASEHMLSDTEYRIYTNDHDFVYASHAFEDDAASGVLMPVLSDMTSDEVFSFFQDSGMQGTYICSRPLKETGWIITSYTPVDSAFLYFGTSISYISLIVILITILLVLIVLKVSMHSISQPLLLLSKGLKETAASNYAHRIQCTRYPNYQSTFNAYNSMNGQIAKLITENYETKLSEKELEIRLIYMQFNPHFLYNMLNVISLMSLEEGQLQVSDMLSKLGYMMRYSTKTAETMVPFHEDLRYVEAYISAMQLRTNNAFEYDLEIDPALMNHTVPKFILQPFVENAILHGFTGEYQSDLYKLRITGRSEGHTDIFTVEDNGKGMKRQVCEALWHKDSSGIGIANTHKRIQLYYGAQYGVRIDTGPAAGTVVTVRIPHDPVGLENGRSRQ